VRETSLDFLSKCLLVTEFRFEAMCSYLGNEILIRFISNIHADRIWPADRRFPRLI